MPVIAVWLEGTPVDVDEEDIVEVSNFMVEDNTDGSVAEVVKGRTVPGVSMIVVPRSNVLFCKESVTYRNVVSMDSVTSVA